MVRTPYPLLAPAYDDVIGRPFLSGLCRAFEQLVAQHRIAFRSAADVGCGTGLFARYLRRRWGVPVFAVDRSGAMLRVARRSPCPGVCYLRQDMRALRLPRAVDLVTANFDTINHLLDASDVRRALRCVHAALHDGGYFIFDALTPCLCNHAGRTLERSLPGGLRLRQEVVRCNPEGRMLLAVSRGAGNRLLRVENTERAYTPAQLARWLRDAGLRTMGVYDASQRAASCPERVIMVARRL